MQKIQEPPTCEFPHMKGIIFKNGTRSDSFDRFLECTNEKEILAKIIKKILKEDGSNSLERSLLDIGTGRGILTRQIKGKFQYMMLVEPDTTIYPELTRTFKGQNYELVPYTLEFAEKEKLIPQGFNTILMDYSLHYFDDYEKILRKLISHAKKGANLIINYTALVNGKGKKSDYAEMLQRFSLPVTGRDELIKPHTYVVGTLANLGLEGEVETVTTEIEIPCVENALNFCDFYFDVPKEKIDPQIIGELAEFFGKKKRAYDGKVIIKYDHAIIHCKIKE